MRKLAWFCGAASATIIINEYLLSAEILPWMIAFCVGVGLAACFLLRERRMLVILVCAGSLLGFTRCWIHHRSTIAPAQALDGQERSLSARVIEYPDVYDSAEYVVVRLYGEHSGMKCRLTSYEGGLAALRPGDEIRVDASLRSARWRFGEETDRYSSKGVFLLGTCLTPPEVTGCWANSFLYIPAELCRRVTMQCSRFFPEDTAPFMAALLSGDKTALYADELCYSRLRMAGLAHVVAISGMHISFLVGLLMLFSGNRKRRAILAVPVLVFFCAMVGFTPSVCRAAFMQIYLLSAGLVERENDTPTALTAILTILLMENPSAAASVGLQLSFAATAGIMLTSGSIHRWLYEKMKERIRPASRGRKLLAGLSANAATTAGALIFTTPLTAMHFGYVSLVSPVSNLLCLWVVSVLFVAGYAVVVFGAVIPVLAGGAAWVLSCLVRYIFLVTDVVCAMPAPVVYTQSAVFVLWLITVYILFAISFLLRTRSGGFRVLVPILLSLLLLISDHLLLDLLRSDKLSVSVLDVGQGQCVALENKKHAVLIDCGSSGSEDNTGEIAAGYLMSRGRERLDAAILTHTHYDHINGMSRLLSIVNVGTLILPETAGREEGAVKELLTIAQRRGTEVYWLREDTDLTLGSMTIRLWAFEGKESDYEKGLGVMAAQKDFEVLILGDMQSYAERLLSARGLPDSEVLVVSHHGSKTSTSEYLLEAAKPDVAVISTGYNSYGHPHNEVLQRLAAHNIEIHRTDLEGTIRIRRE